MEKKGTGAVSDHAEATAPLGSGHRAAVTGNTQTSPACTRGTCGRQRRISYCCSTARSGLLPGNGNLSPI